MSTTTEEALLPKPDLDGSDPADVPADIGALADRLEELLAVGSDLIWNTGDFKLSARSASHGRWLICDGRELTAAQIVTELGLDSGDADDLVALLGTGGSSVYGTASTGKVRLPDPRDRAILGAGSSHVRGSTGGAETHTLTAAESGLKGHGHAVTDPGHVHTASQAAHSHSVGDPGHTHGKTDPGHTHTATQAAHSHSDGTLSAASDGSHYHIHQADEQLNTTLGGGGTRLAGLVSGGTGGDAAATTSVDGAHTHDVTGSTGSATPAITVNSGTTGITILSATTGITLGNATPAITVNSGATGLTVDAAAGADASSAHSIMQPWAALGSVFIRV